MIFNPACSLFKGDRGPRGVPSSAPEDAEIQLQYLQVALECNGSTAFWSLCTIFIYDIDI